MFIARTELKIQDAFNREKDADRNRNAENIRCQKRSPIRMKVGEVSKANIRLEVLDPKEEKILESDSRIAYTGTLVSGNG